MTKRQWLVFEQVEQLDPKYRRLMFVVERLLESFDNFEAACGFAVNESRRGTGLILIRERRE